MMKWNEDGADILTASVSVELSRPRDRAGTREVQSGRRVGDMPAMVENSAPTSAPATTTPMLVQLRDLGVFCCSGEKELKTWWRSVQGDEWRRIRSQTHTSVSAPRAVQAYAKGIADVVDDAISLIASARDEKEEVEDCHLLMRRWALESTMLLTVDERLGVLEPNLDAHSMAANMFNIIEDLFCILNTLTTSFPYYLYFPTPMWRRFHRRGGEAIRLLSPLVRRAAERAEHMAEGERITLAASLRREGKQSLKEIFTFVFDFIMAGSETVAAGATYCLYCLAMNPLAQQKAREDVQSVLNKAPDSEIALKYSELSYVKACIRESLRLYPVITGIHRKLDHDVVMSGYMIPKNVLEAFRVENHHGDIGFLSQLTSRPQRPARFRFILL
ncbi:probable cytochrome P450 12a5, mitochondrial isoform X3 [Dermacentor albipictus]|uniref:probable cytochrome P450 12a5, mitochondrial isoform X3 n=1 Tax=Dermacentor albipictus TaxID=60249 RepID=UPI0031FE0863